MFRRTDMDENYHRHFSNFFSQRSEKTIFRKRKILKLEKLNIESKGYDTFEKQRVSYFVMRKCLKCTDLGVVVIGSAGVDGAGGCGGCWAEGVVILEGGLTVGLAVLQTLGWEVMNHGGLGRDVVVVVAAASVASRCRFNSWRGTKQKWNARQSKARYENKGWWRKLKEWLANFRQVYPRKSWELVHELIGFERRV